MALELDRISTIKNGGEHAITLLEKARWFRPWRRAVKIGSQQYALVKLDPKGRIVRADVYDEDPAPSLPIERG